MRMLVCFLIMVLLTLSMGCGVPAEIQNQLDQLKTENNQLTSDKTAMENEIVELHSQLEECTRNALKDPTYEEAIAFIEADKTDEKVPFEHGLACQTVTENARKASLNCYRVVAETAGDASYGPVGWSFIGFNTSDRGWIYFCTTNICADREVKIVVGEQLYKSNPGFPDPGTDDTVVIIRYVP
jgi:hypothetical protein